MSRDGDIDEREELETSESESEEEIENIENWRKCSQSNRPCRGHKGPPGTKCGQDQLENKAQRKEYCKKLKEKLKGKMKMNKTPRRDQRPTSANPAPVVSGNAPGVSTASTKVSSGAGGQVLSESGLIQQQVNALQILVRISIWSKNTQNCFAPEWSWMVLDGPGRS